MHSFSLFCIASYVIFVATAFASDGVFQKLPLKHIRRAAKTSRTNILHRDQTRARFLVEQKHGTRKFPAPSVQATDIIDYYTVEVGVGEPETKYNLLVDTGSANIWVGALNSSYIPTRTSHNTGDAFSISYCNDTCLVAGEEYLDRITLDRRLVINHQSIGVANYTLGISDFEGIIGLGPKSLTTGTVQNRDEISTVTENLFSQRRIDEAVLGIYFAPFSGDGAVDGELTFGGIDQERITSEVTYTPVTSTYPSSSFWGINQTISYNGRELLSSAGIVDTGTSLLLLASDAFAIYQAAFPGSFIDPNIGLLEIPPEYVRHMQSLYFSIGGTTFEFTPSAQLLPQELNTISGGQASAHYSIVGDLGRNSGEGMDFVNGKFFLERFYSVFDTTNSKVGFATTQHTFM